MENKSETTYSPNIFESKIIDEKGNYREMDFSTFSVDDYFENTNILSGETREGTIIFAVPENDKNLTFVYNYSGDIYKKVEIKFNINVEENK